MAVIQLNTTIDENTSRDLQEIIDTDPDFRGKRANVVDKMLRDGMALYWQGKEKKVVEDGNTRYT